jgi:hypothetical protein
LLDDLARTLCVEADVDIDCSYYPGFDLLAAPRAEMANDEVTLFVVESAESDFRYDSHRSITVKRGKSILGNLNAALNDEARDYPTVSD